MKNHITNVVRNLFLLPGLTTGLALVPACPTTAQTFTTIHSFTGGDGADLWAGLIANSPGSSLFGTARGGGSSGVGTVFKVNTDGTGFTTLHSFMPISDSIPAGTNSDGASPLGGLILSNDTLYGTAAYGGSSGVGTVFKINADGTDFTNLHVFSSIRYPSGPYTNSDGAVPIARLISSGNTLYGAAGGGGSGAAGTLFRLNTDGTGFTNLHSFSAIDSYLTNREGAAPNGLILSGGTLYGTANEGGRSGHGTVFAVKTDGTDFRTLHNFAGYPSDGERPNGGLILSGNTLYGTAYNGGSWDRGTVFKVNTDGTGFTTLYSFTTTTPIAPYSYLWTNIDGANPGAGLLLSEDTLYGTAYNGGSSGRGTVFKINTDGTGFAPLHSFSYYSDGAHPQASLILSGHALYGTAEFGGSLSQGTVFSLSFGLPEVTCSVAIASLWPPNGNLINVGLGVSAAGGSPGPIALNVQVFSNESAGAPEASHFSGGANDSAPVTLRLRSQRFAHGHGRVYLIVATATDTFGNEDHACATVVVPHDHSAASVTSVNAQAAAAGAFCQAHDGGVPPGFVAIGMSPVITSKQSTDWNGDSTSISHSGVRSGILDGQ